MPLTDPPDVQIGTDTTWHATEWDLDTPATQVGRGPGDLTARDVQYLRWTVALDGEVAQVCRLLVAGPAVASPPPDAVVVPVGRHATRARITDTPEVLERATGPVEVTP